jgi:multimeric flavodoxin WrbA
VPNVLIVNGSLGGSTGNTAELLALAEEELAGQATVSHLELVRDPTLARVLEAAASADAFLFGTGTYWDSWGSPLQRFFEMTAHTEGMDYWFGKPAGVIVTAHAVGSKSVLSRLFGVLNVYGMLIPPLAGLAYTWANDTALASAADHLRRELWTPADVEVICHNLIEAIEGGRNWRRWPTCEGKSGDKWLFTYSDRAASESPNRPSAPA